MRRNEINQALIYVEKGNEQKYVLQLFWWFVYCFLLFIFMPTRFDFKFFEWKNIQ